ncbi:MAG: helix-turn-helix domain-containing protein [Gammaproteobacteria bacterium]|nr:helix-turn-helix domain-containing protein [Gammaproteobacteria bacterium]
MEKRKKLIISPKVLAICVIDRRIKLKLSQAEVADLVGLKQQTISHFETHPEGTRIETLFRILFAVNLDLRLLGKEETNNSETEW